MNLHALVTLCFGVLTASFAADDMAIKNQEAKSFHAKFSKALQLDYLLFLPQGYTDDESQRWPLLLFLHGAGERGKDIARVTVHGPPRIVKQKADFPFILISPQCPGGQTWSDELLLALLDEMIEKHRVDPSRVYLTGLSMGGYGTWSLGLKHPERFAAIAPICGGGDLLPILLPPQGKQSALKRLPVWAFHGAKDTLVPLVESERMVNALKNTGNPNVKFTIYPEAGHDSWTETYNNPEFYDWLLEQKLPRSSKTSAKHTKAKKQQQV